jgi:hypothetical protein
MKTLFPPHPNTKITPNRLSEYEESGLWVAQRKFNGTHVLVNVSPDRKVGILTRHGTPPKLFSMSQRHIDEVLSLNLESGKEYWLNGELLDHKTCDPRYKGKLVFFDVLQAGRYLMRSPDQMTRIDLLADICGHPTELEPANGIALAVSERIFMAETFESDFEARFRDHIETDEIEGLILRKRKSVIDNFGRKEYDVSWILRCRKPHAGGNYQF